MIVELTFYVSQSWHDTGSRPTCLDRLRSAGFNVVDRPRPRVADDLSINHGGFRVFLVADVVLEPLTFDQPSMSELVCVRTVVGQLIVHSS